MKICSTSLRFAQFGTFGDDAEQRRRIGLLVGLLERGEVRPPTGGGDIDIR